MSLEKMNKLIHPDDISFVELAETSIRNYFAEHVSSETIGDYKASYCLRLLTTSGNYQLYHHQSMALAVDSKGNCIQTLNILNNINNLTPANNYRVTVQNLKNNHFVELDIYAKKQTIGLFPIFSKRETEIIRLMSLGLKNPEIAQRLFISLHTVKNHRKNILHKAQVHTSSELIALCIHQGLI
jgi:DNA-binding CsgD family transcriptional regulator